MKNKKEKSRVFYGGRPAALVLALLFALCALTACSGGGEDDMDGEAPAEFPVALYFVDAQYIETGDEAIEPMIVKEQTLKIDAEDADDRYEETVELLTAAGEGEETMIRQGMVDGVSVQDGLAVVDFNEDAMHGGSLEETYLIEQVVRTLIKSYEEIDRVRFTVDGQTVDTLMGHLEANCIYGLITVSDETKGDVELVSIVEDIKP